MKRRNSFTPPRSHKKSRRSATQRYKVLDSTSAPGPVWVKNKKVVKVRVPKKVKVSSALAAKIKKVIDHKIKVGGSYTNHYLGGIMFADSRVQTVFANCGIEYDSLSSWLFTAPQFLDAVSVLWNGKPNRPPGASFNYNTQFQNSDNFDTKTTTFTVKDSYSVYTFKNGTQHTVNLILCIGVPKKKMSGCEWAEETNLVQDAAGTAVANELACTGLYESWVDSLNRDTLMGYQKQGYFPSSVVTGQPTLKNASVNDLFRDPTACKTLRNRFAVEEVHIRLMPGQVVKHRIQGPKGLDVDMSKMYDANGVLLNIQKYSRSVCGIVYNDPTFIALASTTNSQLPFVNAVGGRYADQIDVASAGFAITTERTDHYSLTMPEQAGFTLDSIVLGNDQPLDSRFPRTVMNVYDVPAAAILPDKSRQLVDLSVMNPIANVNPVNSGT